MCDALMGSDDGCNEGVMMSLVVLEKEVSGLAWAHASQRDRSPVQADSRSMTKRIARSDWWAPSGPEVISQKTFYHEEIAALSAKPICKRRWRAVILLSLHYVKSRKQTLTTVPP